MNEIDFKTPLLSKILYLVGMTIFLITGIRYFGIFTDLFRGSIGMLCGLMLIYLSWDYAWKERTTKENELQWSLADLNVKRIDNLENKKC